MSKIQVGDKVEILFDYSSTGYFIYKDRFPNGPIFFSTVIELHTTKYVKVAGASFWFGLNDIKKIGYR